VVEGDKMKFLYILLVLFLAIPCMGDLEVHTAVSGLEHLYSYSEYGPVKEKMNVAGQFNYQSLSNQYSDQTYQSTFDFQAAKATLSNTYSISASDKNVGIGQSVSASNLSWISAKTQIGSNPSLLRTDFQINGSGNLNDWIVGSTTSGVATSDEVIGLKQHPVWIEEREVTGPFNFRQGIKATPTPLTLDTGGNWLEQAGTKVYPNGTVTAIPTVSAPNEGVPNVPVQGISVGKIASVPPTDIPGAKIDANGLPAVRLSDYPGLAKLMDNTSIPVQICPTNGEKYKTIDDTTLGKIDVYYL
jgi:hypothetical protein